MTNEDQDNQCDRSERRKDIRKKIRVLVKFTMDSIFESFSYDISSSGILVLARSTNVLNRVSIGMDLEVFIEYNFDTMIRTKCKVVRIQKNEECPEKSGFALTIEEISEEGREMLQSMLESL